MNITKADIETRIAELRAESERVIAQTIGIYDGAIQELERWQQELERRLSLDLESSNKEFKK